MATANANAAPGATRPVDQHVEFVVKVIHVGAILTEPPKLSVGLAFLSSRPVIHPTDFSSSRASRTMGGVVLFGICS